VNRAIITRVYRSGLWSTTKCANYIRNKR